MTANPRPIADDLLRPFVATLLVSVTVAACAPTERGDVPGGATTASTEATPEVIQDEDSAAPSGETDGRQKAGAEGAPRSETGPRLQPNRVPLPMWADQVHLYVPQPE